MAIEAYRGVSEAVTIDAKDLRVGDIIITKWGDDQRVESRNDTHAWLWSVTYDERVGRRYLKGSVEVLR